MRVLCSLFLLHLTLLAFTWYPASAPNNKLKVVSDIKEQTVETKDGNKAGGKLSLTSEAQMGIDTCSPHINIILIKSETEGFNMGKNNAEFEISQILLEEDISWSMGEIFEIRSLWLEDVLEPPTVKEQEGKEFSTDGQRALFYDKKYRITKSSRFGTPSTWDKWMMPTKIKEPNYEFKIRTAFPMEECYHKDLPNMLNEAFLKGYADGSREIEQTFITRLKLLEEYVLGLSTWHRLYKTEKISLPRITKLSIPVYANDLEMVVAERNYELVEESRFVTDMTIWKNVFAKEGSSIYKIHKSR